MLTTTFSLSRRLATSAVLLTLLFAPSAHAEEPWTAPPFSLGVEELLAAAEETEPEAVEALVVLSRHTEYRFDEEGRATYREHSIYRVLDRENLGSWATVLASWAPWHQKTPEVRARVVTSDGLEHELDPSTLSDSPLYEDSPHLFDDRRRLRGPLPALANGAVVEVEIVIRDHQPLFDSGLSKIHNFVNVVPVHLDRLTLDSPKTLPLRFSARRLDEEPERTVDGERVRLVFTRRDGEMLEWDETMGFGETGLPSNRSTFPNVVFSTGESWNAVAKSYAEIVEERLAGADVEAFLASVERRPGEAQSERIARLLDRVHEEVRYTGLELGAASIVPVPPAETLKRKFGDCKDKSTLVAALLRAEGIPAYLALLKTGPGYDVDPRLPGFGRFNHAIVYVPGREPIWIDPTDPFARPGELPTGDQGRMALIAAPSTRELVRTPTARSKENRVVEVRRFHLSDYGEARVVESSTYHGAPERWMRQQIAYVDDESRRENYVDYVGAAYLADELTRFEERAATDLSEPLSIEIEIAKAGRGVTDLEEAVVAVLPSRLFHYLPEELSQADAPERENDYVFETPHVYEWRYEIVPASGFVPVDLPESSVRELGTATLEREVSVEDGVVYAVFRFDSGPRHINAEQFDALREGVLEVLEVLDGEPTMISFEHSARPLVAEGRWSEAVAEHRRWIAAEPENTVHRVRFSNHLLQMGLGGEAKRQARKAVELDPDSGLAHWALGVSLTADELGRRFVSGFDHGGARAELERAVELDPTSDLFVAELAILLEHDEEGMRFSREADLDAAIELHRKLRGELGNRGLEINLLNTLVRAERWQELEELTSELGPGPATPFRIAALAMLEGPKAASREAKRVSANDQARLEDTVVAFQQLMALGHFETSAALMRDLVPITPNPLLLDRFVELLEGVEPIENLEIDDTRPTSVLQRFFQLMADPEVQEEKLAALIYPEPSPEELGVIGEMGSIHRAIEAQSEGMVAKAALDLFLSALTFDVEGAKTLGHRIEMKATVPGYTWAETVYVVKIGGAYKIVAFGDDLSALGSEALRRVEAGDLEGAQQWLVWGREAIRDFPADEDPFALPHFPKLWPEGSGSEAERMRVAAASLMVLTLEPGTGEKYTAPALPILEAALAEAPVETVRALEQALYGAAIALEDHARAIELASAWVEEFPGSEGAYRSLNIALVSAAEWRRLRELARVRIEADPGDEVALRTLANSFMREGRLAEAIKSFEDLIEIDPDSESDLNNLAWAKLFQEPIAEETLELARRAAEVADYANPGSVHTLATAYAELGRPAEAHRVLVQAVGLNPGGEPEPSDLYVLGRIAEEIGLPAEARRLYETLEEPEDGRRTSTWELAQRGLERVRKAHRKG